MSNKRVIVEFTTAWRGYSKGERAGFDAAQAEALVQGGVAKLLNGSKPAAGDKDNKAAAGAKSGKGKAKGEPSRDDPAKEAEGQPADPSTAGEGSDAEPGEAAGSDDDDEPKP